MSRKVTVVNPQTNQPVEINTSAETWGELISEIEAKNISVSGMKGVIRETKVSLQSREAQLPDDDFTLFLFTDKVKSGFDTEQMMKDLRDEFNTAFETIIENINDGVYGEAKSSDCDYCDDLEKLKEEVGG